MNSKTKLKLRKGIISGVPIALFITLLLLAVIFSNNKAELKTSLKETKEAAKVVEEKPVVKMDETKPGYFSTNSFIKDFNEYKNKIIIDNTIRYYAEVFNLNADKVIEIARKYTNDYESENFNSKNTIKDGEFKSLEAGIVYYVRYLYRNPADYGTTSQEIGDSGIVRTAKKGENGHFMLDNGMTYEQFLSKICELYGINRTLALAIVYEESGKMGSTLFTQSNNMGGLRGGTGWLSFPSLEAGTICYVFTLKNLLERSGLDSHQTSSVYAVSGIYVHGNASDPAPEWTGKVLNYMNIIEANRVFE